MSKKSLTALFLAFTMFCLAQEEGVFNKKLSSKDSIQFQNLRQKIVIHINANPDSALYYIEEIKKFSSENNFPSGLADAEYTMGHYYRRMQKMDSAILRYAESQKIANKIGYLKGEARALNALCRGYYFIGETEKSQKAGFDCIAVLKKSEDLAILLDTYTALGNSFMRKNNFTKAVSFFLKADSIHTKNPQRPDIIAAAYQSLGNVYKELKDYTKAIEFYGKANAEFKKLPANAEYFSNNTNMQLGSIYYLTADYKQADSLLNVAYAYFKKIGDENALAQTSTYLGLVNMKLSNPDAAERFLEEGFLMNKNNQFSFETIEAQIKLAELFVDRGNYQKAIQNAQSVLSNNKEANKSIELQANKILSKAYTAIGNHSAANNALMTAFGIRDSIYQNQNQASIRDLETKYQTEKKEQEIALLKSQKELVEQKQKSQRNLLLGGIGLTSLAGLFLFVLFRNRQRTNEKLKELDAVKSNFFANISHEFRTPLTLISAPLQNKLEEPNLNDKDRAELQKMLNNSERLNNLVDQLLDLSKIESGSLQLQIQQGNPLKQIAGLAANFEHAAQQKEITFSTNINKDEVVGWFDSDALNKIVTNLLSNAIKFTPENGGVICNAFMNGAKLHLTVKNSGEGLTDEQQKKVFDRFYQTSKNQIGTGIGLALVKELVTLYKGTITLESTPNEWTSFSVVLPTSMSALGHTSVVEADASEKYRTTGTAKVAEKSKKAQSIDLENEQPIVLIVEDNLDLRQLLKSNFEADYQVLLAKDGAEGVALAIEHIPEIIISDVMMPKKDGMVLTQELKQDERTSHIPIILLTAKASEKSQLEGLEFKADDYITKPFNQNILVARVNNLIETRKALQQRYSQEVVLRPKDIAITPPDQQFLQKVQDVLDHSLVESDFSVEEFSKAVGMSRMQLHRKLKALTGLSATEFVRSQRLKLAAQLLKKSEINVSQVGYSVGFNDHSYFTKCFKELYKCTPSEYAKKS